MFHRDLEQTDATSGKNAACLPGTAKSHASEMPKEKLVEHAATQRLYDRNFFLAAACQTCFVIANTLMAHYARWIEFLGGGVRDVGWITGASAVAGLFLRPWIGQWINRFGPKRVWILGFGVFAIGAIGNLAIVDLGPVIYGLRSFVVLGAAIVFASGLTYVAQVAPVHRQAEAIGIVGIGGFVGMLIGPVLGDVLLSGWMTFPIAADLANVAGRQRSDFIVLFVVASCINLATVGLVLQLRAPAKYTELPLPAGMSLSVIDFCRTVWNHWPGPILLVDLVFGMCMAIPFGFLATYIDAVPLEIPGVSLMGLYFWCYAGSGISLRIVGRRLPEVYGRQNVLLAGCACMTLGLASFSWTGAGNPWMIMVPATLGGVAHALMFHTMTSLTITPFPDHQRGTGSALALMMLDLGTIGGAPVLAIVADRAGFDGMFFVAAGCVAATGGIYLLFAKREPT